MRLIYNIKSSDDCVLSMFFTIPIYQPGVKPKPNTGFLTSSRLSGQAR
jgi:hypothetical protein